MNNKKNGSKRTEKSQDSNLFEFKNNNINNNNNNQNNISNQTGSESTEYPSNTSVTTCSSVTTSPNNNAQTNINESNNQTGLSSNEQSVLFNQNQSLGHTTIPLINYYSYIQGSNPYPTPIDYNAANWTQTIALAKNGISDPIMATYLNATGFTPELTSYDQFNFAYPQAFTYGYGNTPISPMNEFQINQTRNFNKRQSITNPNINSFQSQNYYNTVNPNYQKNRYYNKYSNNKLENDFNNLNLNDNKSGNNFKNSYKNNTNQKNKFMKKFNFNNGNFVNNQNFITNENQDFSNYNEAINTGVSITKSDSKSWANIVGHNQNSSNQITNTNYFTNNNDDNNNNNNQLNEQFNEQIVHNDFSSYMLPNNNSYRNVYDTRKFNINNNNNNNNYNSNKNIYKNFKQFGQHNNQQQQSEFNLDNNAFPPINSNANIMTKQF